MPGYDYVERYYGFRPKVGSSVHPIGQPNRSGRVIRNSKGDAYVYVMFPGLKHSLKYHPQDLVYSDFEKLKFNKDKKG